MAIAKETVQILAIVFFSILILGGVLLLITGCIFESDTESASKYFDKTYRVPGILAIIGGVFLLVGALLGLFGSILLGMWLLVAGIVLVFIALVISVVGGAIAYTNRSCSDCISWDKLKQHMAKYNDNKDSVDKVQRHYRCCGYESPTLLNATGKRGPAKLPASCCKGDSDDCSMSSDDRYEGGCKPSIKSYMRTYGVVLLGLAIIFGIFELLALIFGIMFVIMFWGNPLKKGAGENKN